METLTSYHSMISQGLKDQHSIRVSKTTHPSLHWPSYKHSSFQFTSTRKIITKVAIMVTVNFEFVFTVLPQL